MKKIISIGLVTALGLGFSGCSDFLETSSESVVDREFVFSDAASARGALVYGYETFRDNASLHSVGYFWGPIWGSDIENIQDNYNEGSMTCLETNFFPTGTSAFNINSGEGTEVFSNTYKTIAIANSLIDSFESMDNFSEIMSGEPNELSDIYGQAVALRATMYWELIRWFGDVPHAVRAGETGEGLASRYEIMDYHIAKLREVEPHMYRPGEGTVRADVMNRTYVQGLIGRLCLYNGGYAIRRTDLGADFYVDGNGKKLTFDDWSVEKNQAIYGRRSDWRELYAIAREYLKMACDNHGSVQFHVTDPRGTGKNGEIYNNPFQYAFQQMHARDNVTLADESVYEIQQQANYSAHRPGYIGRPCGGGKAPATACGQDRVQVHFYYGWFDNNDARKDASVCVTGSSGNATEVIQGFDLSNWGRGAGPATNKWDWNRYQDPPTANLWHSSMNISYMRISDIYLMYAEVCAALGDEAPATTYLKLVHNRNYPNGVDPNFDKYVADCGSLYKAVIKERAFEFVGEGVRRFDIIRTGTLPECAVEARRAQTAVVNGIRNQGYYTFPNGNTISAYIWTKYVDAKSLYGYRLTADCPDKNDPVLFPGWRGQHNDWSSVTDVEGQFADVNLTNVAIKGLFNYIDPESEEAKALEADGYEKTPWAIDMINPSYEPYYSTKVMAGYTDADYQAKNPPMHLLPFRYQDLLNSGITNGYGFNQE